MRDLREQAAAKYMMVCFLQLHVATINFVDLTVKTQHVDSFQKPLRLRDNESH